MSQQELNGTEKTYTEGMVDAFERYQTWGNKEDQKVRDNPHVREQMVKLVPELSKLLQQHARQLGFTSGEDCPFQLDTWGDVLLWMCVEFLTQSHFDKESRQENTKAHQLTRAHAAYHFDLEGGA